MEFKINKLNSNAINSYKAIKKTQISESAEVEKKPSGNFDTVEIDVSQSIKSAKANIVSGLTADADAARISMLQARYANGNCPVSIEEIAQAIAGE